MTRRYRAFISYSSSDRAVAKRLHKRVEGYRPPKRLAGARRIAPVFRDRDELSAGHDLNAKLKTALAGSETLIVLCSPDAAASQYVGLEIETFAALHGPEAIFPVIVRGEPPACFPPALLRVAPSPIASDLRKRDGDGFEDGALKLIAGLLPADFAVVKDRELARERRRAQINGALAGLFALLLLASGVAGSRAVEQTRRANEELTRAEAAVLAAVQGVESIVEQVAAGAETGAITTRVASGLLSTAEGMVEGVIALAPDNPRLNEEHGELLVQLARNYRHAGNITASESAARAAIAIFDELGAAGWDRPIRLAIATTELGDALYAGGRFSAAEAAYRRSVDLMGAFTQGDPENLTALRNMAVGLDRVGDVRRLDGAVNEALQTYQDSLGIRQTLTRLDPRNPKWLRDVAVSYSKIGTIRAESRQPQKALASYQDSLQIIRVLATLDPDNAQLSSDVSAAYGSVGDMKLALGDFDGALSDFQASLDIARKLNGLDDLNASWVRDTSVALEKIGDVHLLKNQLNEALAAHRESLALVRDLRARDPDNAIWLRDISVATERVGDVLLAQGLDAAALEMFEEAAGYADQLLAYGAESTDWLFDVSQSLEKLGDAYLRRGETDKALGAHDRSIALRRDLASRGPLNPARERAVWTLQFKVSLYSADRRAERLADVVARMERVEAAGALPPDEARLLDLARIQLATD